MQACIYVTDASRLRQYDRDIGVSVEIVNIENTGMCCKSNE